MNKITVRNQHIDCVKGLGILLVVLGHNWFVINEKGEAFNMIFSFHMPLFFFCAGLFLKETTSFFSLLKSKTDSLLKPYLTACLGMMIIAFILKNQAILDSIKHIATGEVSVIYLAPAWFLPHLFFVFITAWILINLLKNISSPIKYTVIFLTFLLNILYLNGENSFIGLDYSVMKLPFFLDLVFISTGFFLLGFFTKKKIKNFKPNIFLLGASILIFLACHYIWDATLDLNQYVYDSTLISTVEALTGIYIIFSICSYLQNTGYLEKSLSYLGSASLFILIFHYFFQKLSFTIFSENLSIDTTTSAILSFSLGCAIPIIIFEITKRIKIAAIFLLPLKKS